MQAIRALAASSLLSCLATPALAAGKSYVSLALTRTLEESQAQAAKGKEEVLIVNMSGAWVHESGLSLGLKYYDYARNGQALSSTSGTVISGYGPLVGFSHSSGFYGNASYLYKPTKRVNDADRNEMAVLKEGDGYVVDIGKVFDVGGFGVGLQVSYAKVTYKKAEVVGTVDDVKLAGTWFDAMTYPYVAAFIFF